MPKRDPDRGAPRFQGGCRRAHSAQEKRRHELDGEGIEKMACAEWEEVGGQKFADKARGIGDNWSAAASRAAPFLERENSQFDRKERVERKRRVQRERTRQTVM
jgi:hypothetical protein